MTTELSISGVLPASLRSTAVERLTAHTESGEAFALDETVFNRPDGSDTGAGASAGAAAAGGQVVRVRAMRTRSYKDGEAARWSVQVNQRPEPPRTAPRAMQYGVVEFAVEEGNDPRSFVHALGFEKRVFELHQRGVRFKRGAVFVDVFQLFESSEATEPLDAASFAVTASTRFSSAPARSSAGGGGGTPQPGGPSASSADARDAALAALEQVAALLKGLVDLERNFQRLASSYLPSSLRPCSNSPNAELSLATSLLACRSIDVVFEPEPHTTLDSFISPTFFKRCEAVKSAEDAAAAMQEGGGEE